MADGMNHSLYNLVGFHHIFQGSTNHCSHDAIRFYKPKTCRVRPPEVNGD